MGPMKKEAKIYVAGHTGLLGSSLLRILGQAGYNNIIVQTREQLDLTDQRAVTGYFTREKPEYVFLAAGVTGGIVANQACPAGFFHSNISIQDNVFEAAQANGVERLAFYGSSCVYPKQSAQPIKEEYLMTGPIEETSAAYAVAKISGLIACAAYNKQYKAGRFIALVPNSMYGPNDDFDPERAHVLSALIRKFHEARTNGSASVLLWGSGRPTREFVHVDDVARASLFALDQADRLENVHYNVGTGVETSIAELARLIASVVGFRGEIIWDQNKPDGAARKLLDSSRFRSLGWKPEVSLVEGIRSTYEWYIKHLK